MPNNQEGDHHVYVYDQLNESTYTARFPIPLTQHAIANNGKHIAAVGAAIDGRNFNLYWHNIESGETIELVKGVSDMRPDISGDGNFVAYVQEINGIPQISVFDRGAQPEPTYSISGRVIGPLGDPLSLVQIKDSLGNTKFLFQ